MTSHNSILGRLNKRAGLRLERTVAEALEVMLAWLNLPDFKVVTQSDHGPYDIELIHDGRRAFIEVKGSKTFDRLIRRVNEAFRREHPEPFCVVGVLGYPERPEILIKGRKAWIWVKPGRDGRLGQLKAQSLERWLKQAGLI